jgi:hypothetical protein
MFMTRDEKEQATPFEGDMQVYLFNGRAYAKYEKTLTEHGGTLGPFVNAFDPVTVTFPTGTTKRNVAPNRHAVIFPDNFEMEIIEALVQNEIHLVLTFAPLEPPIDRKGH